MESFKKLWLRQALENQEVLFGTNKKTKKNLHPNFFVFM